MAPCPCPARLFLRSRARSSAGRPPRRGCPRRMEHVRETSASSALTVFYSVYFYLRLESAPLKRGPVVRASGITRLSPTTVASRVCLHLDGKLRSELVLVKRFICKTPSLQLPASVPRLLLGPPRTRRGPDVP
ncbi:hypothetical protein NDU88_001062 [Pleurodeles waltl]|uniref:Uncharacterized protein n=1 Tax=Pleurodeles waltl TaxID=8319 RepID=A0AAV7R9N6_PLEWA|nr:hypothetical protein NDU88_001062 [Pleurodeles waltl]